GAYNINLFHTDSGKILIGDSYLSCYPDSIVKTLIQGENSTALVYLTNKGETNLSQILASLSSNLGGSLTISRQPESTLEPGKNSSVELLFSTQNQRVGAYSGMLIANASGGSECSTLITLSVTSTQIEDTQGPAVTTLNISPPNPNSADRIVVSAMGDETSTGNNTVSSCLADIDYAEIWNAMSAKDGFYDEIREEVFYEIGLLSSGQHVVRVKCLDSLSNAGQTATHSFFVNASISDNIGPSISYLNITPTNPNESSQITVDAIADELLSGGSRISSCEIGLDYNGTWQNMTAIDGAYDEVVESVTYNLGNLSAGSHTIRIKCTDSLSNTGPSTILGFIVTQSEESRNKLLLLSASSIPGQDADENRWIAWLQYYSSSNRLNWSFDVFTYTDVTSNNLNLSTYKVAILVGAPSSDDNFYNLLRSYKNSGHFIILLGKAFIYGGMNLNLTTSTSSSISRDALIVITSHPVTSGYAINNEYATTTSNAAIYYNTRYRGTNILSIEGYPTRTVTAEHERVISFGVSRPDILTADGETFVSRIINYSIANSR
ncbi:MAG: hypothetical protein QXN01_01900, partial [Candidatus Anstonellales archaeon]